MDLKQWIEKQKEICDNSGTGKYYLEKCPSDKMDSAVFMINASNNYRNLLGALEIAVIYFMQNAPIDAFAAGRLTDIKKKIGVTE